MRFCIIIAALVVSMHINPDFKFPETIGWFLIGVLLIGGIFDIYELFLKD